MAQLVAAGAVVIVAAGNSAANACAASPSGATAAIAVAAIDATSTFASFSNTGACVAVAAPGVLVTSAWIGSPTASKVLSGTSMSSPLVAGVAALVLEAFPDATPAAVRATIGCDATTKEIVALPAGTIDAILFSPPAGFLTTCDAGPPPPTSTAAAPASPAIATALGIVTAAVVALLLLPAGG